MVSKFDRNRKKIIHLSVNACLAPVCSMHGMAVTTVEGIGSVASGLHPVQERIAKAHGSQCGFCTPGIVMSMYALLRSLPGKPTMEDMEIAFQGNLCRCTGYRPIIEGYRTFTEDWEQRQRLANSGRPNGTCGMGEKCCRNGNGTKDGDLCKINGESCPSKDESLFNSSEFKPYDPTQEPIFPPELQVKKHSNYLISDAYDKQFVVMRGKNTVWYRPTSLQQLLELKAEFPNAKLVNGNTEIGVEVKFKNFHYPVLILPTLVPELTATSVRTNDLKIGASVTLSELESVLKSEIKIQPAYRTRVFQAINEMLHWFAGKQIRNVGVVGGNIMTGSPISDLNPIFMAAGCNLELQSKEGGIRVVPMDQTFWTGYRKNVVKEDEILTAIYIPYTEQSQYFEVYKQAKRRDDDIAIVNAAFNLKLDGTRITSISMAYGGMAPTTLLANTTALKLAGKTWSEETLNNAYTYLMEELPLDPGAPGGMIQYRRSLTLSFFFKFYLSVCGQLEREGTKIDIPPSYKSGETKLRNLTPESSQYFTVIPSEQEKTDLVGRPIVHKSAFKQATGEAVYCDDMPRFEGELYLCLVTSVRPHARIVSIDSSEALKVEGVVDFVCVRDVPSDNTWGPIEHDEEVFASNKVTCQGQVIGAIIAENYLIAQKAKKLVKIVYDDLNPVILTIEDAIREGSYFENCPMVTQRGDSEEAFKTAAHVVEGDMRVGGQEHFYLETQAVIAVPKKEDDEMEMYLSTQHPTEIQHLIGHVLGVPANRIVCKVKRLGGGFGGKESRACILSLPAAVAAYKLKKPIRAMLDRDEDMVITGQRHPFYGKYKIGVSSTGKIVACDITLYSNAGNTTDLSFAVMERAMFHCTNAFYAPNITVRGYVCKTNLPSYTAFRGFGAPQGMIICETMIRQVAETLGLDIIQLTEDNLYKEGDYTHFNQLLTYCTLDRCWSECLRDSHFSARKDQVQEFNRANRWRKRGIAIVPTMFGISFTTLFLNQAGALVMIYSDGSVLISHGGAEMGQGLHTKMIQVASRALGISADYIHISETSTDKVPNTSATAASAGSDLNGMAILIACNELNERLKPIKEAKPKGTWEEWIKQAYLSRISLATSGFYRTPDIGYNRKENRGNAFNYFTYGAACSEVEIDCLTGDHQVLRTDIVMDLGESLNPAIDIGQVEGAFMQGYGLFTMEEVVSSPTGTLYSRGPGAYKIPSFSDIPAVFNVSLLKGAPNPRAVYSSKAVGEPPLFLASSVFFAIREAIKSARIDAGLTGWFKLTSPATAAKIRMACEDEIARKVNTIRGIRSYFNNNSIYNDRGQI
ncbi:hypothetical protein AAG570_003578 [Ranatra chinensis]|uniref:FAD-binding PCMH-type domain-containing protein n=1 Tax=Ranatra chinensis TaxID=642074 RepID=A0ABD0YM33_9HEMI